MTGKLNDPNHPKQSTNEKEQPITVVTREHAFQKITAKGKAPTPQEQRRILPPFQGYIRNPAHVAPDGKQWTPKTLNLALVGFWHEAPCTDPAVVKEFCSFYSRLALNLLKGKKQGFLRYELYCRLIGRFMDEYGIPVVPLPVYESLKTVIEGERLSHPRLVLDFGSRVRSVAVFKAYFFNRDKFDYEGLSGQNQESLEALASKKFYIGIDYQDGVSAFNAVVMDADARSNIQRGKFCQVTGEVQTRDSWQQAMGCTKICLDEDGECSFFEWTVNDPVRPTFKRQRAESLPGLCKVATDKSVVDFLEKYLKPFD